MSRAEDIAAKLSFPVLAMYNEEELKKWADNIGFAVGKMLFALAVIEEFPVIVDTAFLAKDTLDKIEEKLND